MLDELVEFYYKFENHFPFAQEANVRRAFAILLEKDRIVVAKREAKIAGYMEYFRLDYARLGWVVCGNRFDIGVFDIENGNIAYVANVLTDPDAEDVIDELKKEFFDRNRDVEFVVGNRNGKRYKPLAVFRRK